MRTYAAMIRPEATRRVCSESSNLLANSSRFGACLREWSLEGSTKV